VGLRRGVAWQRDRTWRFQDLAGIPRTRTEYAERRTRSVPFLRWMERTWARRGIAAKRQATRARKIIHLALWRCIHRGEGDGWDPSHTYSGPLQMTSYWAGYPVYDWNAVPLREVYADAEAQLRVHLRRGDASAWLSQQWPNTSPPCAGLA
jgi:hypothetical protein